MTKDDLVKIYTGYKNLTALLEAENAPKLNVYSQYQKEVADIYDVMQQKRGSEYRAIRYRTKPVRVQRKRIKGWKMPENTVYVGRGSKWGNPFIVGQDVETQEDAVRLFRHLVKQKPDLIWAAKNELAGKNLACWCSLEKPCHADVWLELIRNS
jgi:hypothetical protein